MLIRVRAGDEIDIWAIQNVLWRKMTCFLNQNIFKQIRVKRAAKSPSLCFLLDDSSKVENGIRTELMETPVKIDNVAFLCRIP